MSIAACAGRSRARGSIASISVGSKSAEAKEPNFAQQRKKPAPYTGRVRAYANALDEFLSRQVSLNRQQRQALRRLRLEVGGNVLGFDASPHQLSRLWGCSLPTARTYIRAFITVGIVREISPSNRGARRAAIYGFNLTAFPQFGDVIKKPSKAATPVVHPPEPKKETVPSLEREKPSLRSGVFSSRENHSSRKAPEAGALASKPDEASGGVCVSKAVLEHGAAIIQRVVGLEPCWARKAMAYAASAFKTWEELEHYATAVELVMRKVQAKGTLPAEDLSRMAFKALIRAKEARRRRKILREASQVPGFLARLKAREEAQAQMVEGSLLAGSQTVVVGGIRVKAPGALPALAIQPYFAWITAQASLPAQTDPGYLARFDEEREAFQEFLKALEGELAESRRTELEADLADRLVTAGLSEGGAVWNRAWRTHWANRVLNEWGLKAH